MSQINVDTVRNRTSTNGGPTFDKGLTVSAGTTAYVYGNLQVDGTETIINTETLNVADKTVGIGSTSNASNTTADGAGIEIYGGSDGNKTLTWNNTGNTWTFGPTNVTATVGSGVTIYGSTGIVSAITFKGDLTGTPTLGTGVTVYSSGIVSATSYRGDGGSLTGIAATDNINTNNIAISGIATVGTSITMRDGAINVTGVITATSFEGDGSALSGIEAGITTESNSVSSGYVTINLNKDDHKVTASGVCTVTCTTTGTEGGSGTLRITNSGITTIGFSTYFLWPSGGAPSIPTATGTISLISYTINRNGSAGIATQLLAGASIDFS